MNSLLPLYGPETDDSVELGAFIEGHRDELRASWRTKQAKLEQMLIFMRSALQIADSKGVPAVTPIWNAAGYITLVSFDMSVLGELQMFEEEEWQRRYHARNACLLIFEALDDLPNVLGRAYREAVLRLPTGQNLLEQIALAQKELSKMREDQAAELKKIRTYVGAHRDNSAEEQLKVIFALQPSKVLRLSASFDAALNALGQRTQAALMEASRDLDLYSTSAR